MSVRGAQVIFTGLLLAAGVFSSGVYIGYENRPEVQKVISAVNKEPAPQFSEDAADFAPFWKTWNLIDEKFAPTRDASGTSTEYVKKTSQERVWGATEGLVRSLGDPYSIFLPPQDAEIFEENINGNFGGVGIEIGMRDNTLTVIAPLKNTPASRAGILSGDKILAIDGIPTAEMSVEEAVQIIRGEVGTDVALTLSRDGSKESFEVVVTRAVINIPTIDTKLRTDDVFVIELYNFSASSPNLFREALREFVRAGTDKLIIDLRGNPGGYLEAAVDMASWFLPAGKIIVTEDFGGNQDPIVYRSKGYDVFNENLKLGILIDQGSASASEIFAGALSEHGRATLVGAKTFGKGSVQELIKVTPETSLKITVAHWLTPEGHSFSKNGLEPDIAIPFTAEDKEKGMDPQIEKAAEVLKAE